VAAVVTPDGIVHLKPVQLGRDLGSSIEVPGGLGDHDAVIVAPPDDVQDGDHVRATPADIGGAQSGNPGATRSAS
jgi:hypothetical protein